MNADQNPRRGSPRVLRIRRRMLSTHVLVWLMPFYVIAMTVIDVGLGPHRPDCAVALRTVIGLDAGALLFFAAGIRWASSWERQRRAAVEGGRRTGAVRVFLDRHPHLAELLVVAAGTPPNQALGWLAGLALSAGLSYGMKFALAVALHGTAVSLLIPVNTVGYTALVASATYLNSRRAPPGCGS